jgi:hypothetical protein
VADGKPLDTVTRFNDRAADYVRYRPTYPATAPGDLPEHAAARSGRADRPRAQRLLRAEERSRRRELLTLLRDLHAHYADDAGLATLVYGTEVFTSTVTPSRSAAATPSA